MADGVDSSMQTGPAQGGQNLPDPVRIAHLSDLHLQPREDDPCWTVWRSLHDFLVNTLQPHMVLITGDLADSPSARIYRRVGKVIQALDGAVGRLHGAVGGPVVWVCAGNHDRHWRGNARFLPARTKFDGEPLLQPHVPLLKGGPTRVLGDDRNRWPVRVVSVDTSRHARRSAQAFLPRKERDQLRDLWSDDKQEPPRLVIMLFHHHLLPLPASESDEQGWGSMFNFAGAVNPGKILEDLAASQVDLVLHGHEHYVNRARYGSYARETGQVGMIAAASATGMRTLEGCSFDRASFNVIELRPDRSVWCQEIKGRLDNGRGAWAAAGDAIEILDPTALRQNMFHRALRQQRRMQSAPVQTRPARATESAAAIESAEPVAVVPQTGPASEYAKHFVLTTTRDADVTEIRSNWRIDRGSFTVVVQNDTGLPRAPAAALDVRLPPEVTHEPTLFDFMPVGGRPRAWTFGLNLHTDATVVAPRLRTSYVWQDAALLCSADLALIDPSDCGPHRCDGQEFVAVEIDRPLSRVTLSVSFPPGFVPDERTVGVFTHRQTYQGTHVEIEPSIAGRLHMAGQTIFLTLPFPLVNLRYVIAWTPPPGPPPSDLARAAWSLTPADPLGAVMDPLGAVMVRSALDVFGRTPLRGRVNVAAYMPIPNGSGGFRILRRIGLGGNLEDGDNPPRSVDLRDAPSAYQGAWWNETVVVVAQSADPPEQRLEDGLLPRESLFACLPVHPPGDAGPTLAILRIGLSLEPASLGRADVATMLRKTLVELQAGAISSLLQEL
jgi:predicted MPP superfamily phosphohydrolase